MLCRKNSGYIVNYDLVFTKCNNYCIFVLNCHIYSHCNHKGAKIVMALHYK